jgi:hypothetical protein
LSFRQKVEVVGHDTVGVNRERPHCRFRAEGFQQPSAPARIRKYLAPIETAKRQEITLPADIIESRETNALMAEHDCSLKRAGEF